jgi:GWxTD domain-containing protein
MPLSRSTICAALLLLPSFCVKPILAQEKPPHHPCFEQPNGGRDAIRRIPESARYWLVEDAVYIITPEERCAFLHLNTDEEREQFIEQFWYRRTVDPISLDHNFKTEHYCRIVLANEMYGGQLAGWKTDRGRIYVLFGPPDSVDLLSNQRAAGEAANQDADTHLHPAQKWRYHYINGIGEDVEFHFEFVAGRRDYALADSDQNVLVPAHLSPDLFPITAENVNLSVTAGRPPKIKSKDLEALVVAQVVRDQVKFSHQIKFAAATHATTMARSEIQIPCEACTHKGQVAPAAAYPLFVRVSKPSGWVVDTLELVADMAVDDRSSSGLTLTAHLDVPLAPGKYELAIATKNASTGEVGSLRTQLEVPSYQSLEEKN